MLKLFVGKLKSKWPSLLNVLNAYPSSAIDFKDHEKRMFKVNGKYLKYFYIGDLRVAKVEALHFNDI